MPGFPLDQRIFFVVQIAALLALIIRLWWTELHRVYVVFFRYLLLELLQMGVLALVPYRSDNYRYVWMITEGLIVCFYVLMVLEAYTIALRDLKGIASVSRRYIKASMGVAIVVSLLLLAFEKVPSYATVTFMVFERVIVSSLVFFVLLVTAFLVYYPVPLNRNGIVYSIGFAVYFLAKAAVLLFENHNQAWYHPASTLLMGVSTACLVFWIFALNKSGETKTLVIGHQWNSGEEERLLLQLQAINASLLRAARK